MNALRLFEYEKLKVGQQDASGHSFTRAHWETMARYKEKHDVPWYDLGHKSIQFKNFVGVISLGDLSIEILPKVDRHAGSNDMGVWQNVLIDMLQQVGDLPIQASNNASLRRHQSNLLDLYFELFLLEIEQLLHRGLIKRYRQREGNLFALKGALRFQQHIAQNTIHKERFYTRHTVYDQKHKIHAILLLALRVIFQTHTDSAIRGKCGNVLLHFPEQDHLRITPADFEGLAFDRKSEPYRKALQIAELILLHYHPDIRSGSHELLAIVFDMNDLWERWVLHRLRRDLPSEWEVRGQSKFAFYQKAGGHWRSIRPDLVLFNKVTRNIIVWDTKWKVPKDQQSAIADIHQMHSYAQTVGRGHPANTALLYPGPTGHTRGFFHESTSFALHMDHPAHCDQLFLNIVENGRLVKQLNGNWLDDVLLGIA